MTPDFRSLKRYPLRPRELLQAWDSADELILEHAAQLALTGKRILVVNDSFGALSAGLYSLGELSVYTDSYISVKAIELNTQGAIHPLHSLGDLQGSYDFVFGRIPKNQSFFEDLLCTLSHHLHAKSQLVFGVMVKHQAKTSFDLLNRIIGKTHTSLAKKKARLIFAGFEQAPVASPYPLEVSVENFEKPFINPSNLFSREKLDIGTRFFLENLPDGDYRRILDLGCANGIIGISAKKLHPKARLHFSDESWMAVESARMNYESYFSDPAEFHWIDCFENQAPSSLDLVLCNPPFHQGTTLGDAVARQMFKDAHHALAAGGLLRVIGNSHLKYQVTLKRIFGNSEIVATNAKFMVVDAQKD